MENQVDISRLIREFISGTISERDMQLLREWENESEENRERFKNLTKPAELIERVAYWPTAGGDKEKAWQILMEKRQKADQVPVLRLNIIRRYWQIAAAVVIIVVGTAIYFRLSAPADHNLTPHGEEVSMVSNDALPGGAKAILKLADGSAITLDSTASGILAKQGDLDIVNGNGSISYQGTGMTTDEVIYNTLTVPRGGQYRLLLKDGTKVWLNSASSIRYPTVFTPGMERSVEVTGEVYFEVAKMNDKKGRTPFVVGTPHGVKVEVLGTHFNINAYDDEQSITTTLLEGKVRVFSGQWSGVSGKTEDGKNQVILKPGDQAVFPQNGNRLLTVNKAVDIEQVMAWKNGRFYFHNTELATIMRQISRWYDVEIVYEGKVPQFKLNGEASRSLTLAKLLSMLELTDVKVRIEGTKLIIPEEQ